METAAAAHVCYANGVPFLAVRSVTDTEDDVGLGSFYENAAFASRNSFLVVEGVFKRLNKAVSLKAQ
jgi:adenosylhomocysteine nucleosidase